MTSLDVIKVTSPSLTREQKRNIQFRSKAFQFPPVLRYNRARVEVLKHQLAY